jgi:hypothetical protein
MQQLSIDYFWPLTEQIPLDLDYTDCAKSQPSIFFSESSNFTLIGSSTVAVSPWITVTTNKLNLDIEQTIIKVNTKPPLIRRWLYKLLGLNWEIK